MQTDQCPAPSAAANDRCCPKCGETKPTELFAKRGRSAGGEARRASICKVCDTARARERYHRDGDRTRRRRRELRAADPQRQRSAARRRYWRDPERHRAAGAARRRTQRGRAQNARVVERWKAAPPEAVAAHRTVQRAKRRGQIVVPARCATPACNGRGEHARYTNYATPRHSSSRDVACNDTSVGTTVRRRPRNSRAPRTRSVYVHTSGAVSAIHARPS